MKDERKPVGWGFWLQWVLASIVGFSVGFGLGKFCFGYSRSKVMKPLSTMKLGMIVNFGVDL